MKRLFHRKTSGAHINGEISSSSITNDEDKQHSSLSLANNKQQHDDSLLPTLSKLVYKFDKQTCILHSENSSTTMNVIYNDDISSEQSPSSVRPSSSSSNEFILFNVNTNNNNHNHNKSEEQNRKPKLSQIEYDESFELSDTGSDTRRDSCFSDSPKIFHKGTNP